MPVNSNNLYLIQCWQAQYKETLLLLLLLLLQANYNNNNNDNNNNNNNNKVYLYCVCQHYIRYKLLEFTDIRRHIIIIPYQPISIWLRLMGYGMTCARYIIIPISNYWLGNGRIWDVCRVGLYKFQYHPTIDLEMAGYGMLCAGYINSHI